MIISSQPNNSRGKETKIQKNLLTNFNYDWKGPKVKDPTIRHNQTCELCSQFVPVSTTVLKCIYCNVVCHERCFQNYQKKSQQKHDPSSDWICFYCEDSMQYDKKYFHEMSKTIHNQGLYLKSQITISKHWRRYSQRKKYLRIYSVIVKMQTHFQIRKQKKQFLLSIQNKLRTLKIRIHSINNLFLYDRESKKVAAAATATQENSNGLRANKKEHEIFYIISVVDNHPHAMLEDSAPQTWRLESTLIPTESYPNSFIDVNIDEKFVLGGVSGFQTVLITLFQKSFINNGRDIFLGQLAIDLSIKNLWKTGGKFNKIPFHHYQYEVKDSLGIQPLKLELTFYERQKENNRLLSTSSSSYIKPPTISYEIISTNTMNAECCYCYGTSVDEILKELTKLHDTTGFILPSKKFIHANHHQHQLKVLASISSPSVSGKHSNSSNNSTTAPVSIEETLNPSVLSPTELSNLMQNGDKIFHSMKKMWISIADGKIYLFGYFGDPLKLIIDLQYFSVSFEFAPSHKANNHTMTPKHQNNNQNQSNNTNSNLFSNNVIYKLYRMGYPEFHFYPCKEADIFPMKCAFLTSLRYSKRFAVFPEIVPHSISTYHEASRDKLHGSPTHHHHKNNLPHHHQQQHITPPPAKDKFDLNSLLQDLLALEVLKTKKTALKEAILYTTTTPSHKRFLQQSILSTNSSHNNGNTTTSPTHGGGLIPTYKSPSPLHFHSSSNDNTPTAAGKVYLTPIKSTTSNDPYHYSTTSEKRKSRSTSFSNNNNPSASSSTRLAMQERGIKLKPLTIPKPYPSTQKQAKSFDLEEELLTTTSPIEEDSSLPSSKRKEFEKHLLERRNSNSNRRVTLNGLDDLEEKQREKQLKLQETRLLVENSRDDIELCHSPSVGKASSPRKNLFPSHGGETIDAPPSSPSALKRINSLRRRKSYQMMSDSPDDFPGMIEAAAPLVPVVIHEGDNLQQHPDHQQQQQHQAIAMVEKSDEMKEIMNLLHEEDDDEEGEGEGEGSRLPPLYGGGGGMTSSSEKIHKKSNHHSQSQQQSSGSKSTKLSTNNNNNNNNNNNKSLMNATTISSINKKRDKKKINNPSPSHSSSSPSFLSSESTEDPLLMSFNETQKQIYYSILSELEKKKAFLSDEFKNKLIEQLTIEDVVVNEKYQKFGENFIEKLMMNLSEHQIKSHTFHSHHLTSELPGNF